MSARHRMAGIALLVLAAAAGCGDDDNDGPTQHVPTPTMSATPSATTTPTPEPTVTPVCNDGRLDFGLRCRAGEFCRGGCILSGAGGLCIDVPCGNDCVCPAPACGDGVLDAGEECEGPGFSSCRIPDGFGGETWALCSSDCRCPSP